MPSGSDGAADAQSHVVVLAQRDGKRVLVTGLRGVGEQGIAPENRCVNLHPLMTSLASGVSRK